MGKKINRFKLDPTLNWKFAEIIDLDNSQIKFVTINKNNNKEQEKGILNYKNVKWSLSNKKTISDEHKIGDIIFVKKKKIIGLSNSILR